MAGQINVGTLVSSAIRPNNSADPISSAYSNEILGGHHTYATLAERNSIIIERRQWGMIVSVYADPNPINNKTYQLKHIIGGLLSDNANWVDYIANSTKTTTEWANSVNSVLLAQPASPANGDRYLVGTSSSSTISGGWATNAPGFIAEFNTTWAYTYPTNGYSVRVDNESNILYKYNGIYPTGFWSHDKLTQIYSLDLSGDGNSYTGTTSNTLTSYSSDMMLLCKFNISNATASLTVNVDGIGSLPVKKPSNTGLIDLYTNEIKTNNIYSLFYDKTAVCWQFIKTYSNDSFNVLFYVGPNEHIVIPPYVEYLIYGDLTVDGGTIINYGKITIQNGDLIIINNGVVSNLNNGIVELVKLEIGTGTASTPVGGATGPAGPQGPAGIDGATGPAGPAGAAGSSGSSGVNGVQGIQGANGSSGSSGANGSSGSSGSSGVNGSSGSSGVNGAQGIQGPVGATGPAGAGAQQGLQDVIIKNNLINTESVIDLDFDSSLTIASMPLSASANTPYIKLETWQPGGSFGNVYATIGVVNNNLNTDYGDGMVSGIRFSSFGATGSGGGIDIYNLGGRGVVMGDLDTTGYSNYILQSLAPIAYVKQALDNQIVITGNLTIDTTHNGKIIYIENGASNITITINSSSYEYIPLNGQNYTMLMSVEFVQNGTGTVTFLASGVTLNSEGSKLKIIGQYGKVSLKRQYVGAGNGTYMLFGDRKV